MAKYRKAKKARKEHKAKREKEEEVEDVEELLPLPLGSPDEAYTKMVKRMFDLGE